MGRAEPTPASGSGDRTAAAGTVRVGISGWTYPPWRGVFYPPGLAHKRELGYVAETMASVEINGTFYALQRPDSFRAWLAVKGPRFITHMRKLNDVRVPLANFLASGVLALGAKLGPLLWQLPPTLGFDAGRLADFFAVLPRSSAAAALLAREHDERMTDRCYLDTDADRPLRHALEVRHRSFCTPEFTALLRAHDVAVVVADTAGKWPQIRELTADFAYLRLHGDQELYTSGYTDAALRDWAALIGGWAGDGHDVFAYFDNDVKVRAPFDAIDLGARLAGYAPAGFTPRSPRQAASR